MRQESLSFLRALIEAPSPSGFEQPAQKIVRAEMKKYADEVRTDVHGNVIGIKNAKADFKVMLAGHCDEVGLMVNHVDDKGYIFFAAIGGVDPAVTAGQRVTVHSERGPIPGVVGRKAIHLMEQEERGKPLKLKQQWIDIGAKDRKDALKVVAIGDPVTIVGGLQELRSELAAARGFDDKVGAFVCVETLRLLARKKVRVGVHSVSTVQEELGLRGARTSAFGIDPQVGIAIDVGFASDYPDADKKAIGEVQLGDGPVLHRGANINPVLAGLMERAAKQSRIPFQMQAEPRATGTDANAIQISRAGVAAALISIPNRYMHTPVEVCSLRDLENAARLIAATIEKMTPGMDFTP